MIKFASISHRIMGRALIAALMLSIANHYVHGTVVPAACHHFPSCIIWSIFKNQCLTFFLILFSFFAYANHPSPECLLLGPAAIDTGHVRITCTFFPKPKLSTDDEIIVERHFPSSQSLQNRKITLTII